MSMPFLLIAELFSVMKFVCSIAWFTFPFSSSKIEEHDGVSWMKMIKLVLKYHVLCVMTFPYMKCVFKSSPVWQSCTVLCHEVACLKPEIFRTDKWNTRFLFPFWAIFTIVWVTKGSNSLYTYDLEDWTYLLVKS